MSKVAIVTDSTSYIPLEFLEKYPIKIVPASLIWSGEVLRDGIDIQPAAFYARLRTARELPTTSQPTPKAFQEVFENLLAQGYEVLGVFLSSKLSGTYASAEQALKKMPNKGIAIIDSLTGSMGAGWPIISAAKAAIQGASLEECRSIVEKALKNVGILLVPESLEYLQRGGRIGRAQRFVGDILQVKPILEVVGGSFIGLERVRTTPKALKRMLEILVKRVENLRPIHLGVLHADAKEKAQQLLIEAEIQLRPEETLIADVSPAVGSHLGPGTVGFAYMAGIA
jgi:DegV family protein with EDD domain